MSEENVEILRAIYEAFNRRDWDAMFRHTDPEFTFTYRNPGPTPDARTRRGREEVMAFAEEYGGAFDKLIWEPEKFFDGEDRIVAFVNVHSRPRGGSVDIVVPNGHLWKVREGVVLSFESLPEPQSALEAAGLSQSAMSEEERLIRAVIQAFNDGAPQRAPDLFNPDLEMHDLPSMPDAAWHYGIKGAVEWSVKWQTMFPDAQIEASDVRPSSGNRVFFAFKGSGHGIHSGVLTEIVGYGVGTVRNGKLSRLEFYVEESDALEAAGLSE